MSKKEFSEEKKYSYIEAIEENKNGMSGEEKLMRAIGDVEEKYIKESEPKISSKIKVFKIASYVACFVVLVLSGILINNLVGKNKVEDGGVVEVSEYKTLDELLEHLGISKDDVADGNHSDFHLEIEKHFGDKFEKDLVTYGSYVYKIVGDKVLVTKINNMSGEIINEIEGNANHLTIAKDMLIVRDEYTYINERYEDNPSPTYRIYDLSTPDKPKLSNTYTFGSGSSDYAIVGEELWLLSWDGACGCGYENGFYEPKIMMDDETIIWSDEEVTILGEPSVIQYVAITKINIGTGKIVEKQVYYGEISKVIWSENWMVVDVDPMGKKGAFYVYDMDKIDAAKGKLDIDDISENIAKSGWYKLSDAVVENGKVYIIGISYPIENRGDEKVSALIWDTKSNEVIWRNTEGGITDIKSIEWNGNSTLCSTNLGAISIEFEDGEIRVVK